MTIATGAEHTLHQVAETVYGTTPATPTFINIPITAVSPGLTKDSLESGTLRPDRIVEDLRHGNKQVGGSVSSELEYGALDPVIEAMAMGTWTADVLKTGTTRRSFTFERYFALDTDEYHRYTGIEYNSMSLSVQPNAMVTCEFGVIGQDMSVNTSQVAGATYPAGTNNQPFDSFSGTIQEGGVSIADVTQIDLSWENGLEPAFVIGSDVTIRPSVGKSRLTGTLTAFFQNSTLYNKFINETSSAIVFSLVDPAGNSLTFNIPNIKYTSGNPDVSGDGRVTLAMEFTAIYDATEDSNITITRAAA